MSKSWGTTTWVLCGAGLVLLGAIVAFDVSIVSSFVAPARSRSYVAVPGVVTAARPEVATGGETRHRFEYTYSVNGRDHTGTRYAAGMLVSGGSATLAARFPEGTPVTVFHAPADPGDAVLAPGFQPGDLLPPLVLILVNFPLLIPLGWWLTARRSGFDPANRRIVARTATGWIVWTRRWCGPGTFLIALLCTAAGGIFVGLAAFGDSLTWAAGAVIWVVVLVVPWRLAAWVASGEPLTVDEKAGVLTATRRREPERVPFAAVCGFAVGSRDYSDTETTRTCYICEVTWADGGATRTTELASLGTLEAVTALAEWLRTRPGLPAVGVSVRSE